MKTLDELWYGNISPFEQCTRGDKRLTELLKLVARNREELDGTLTDKQKETLEKLEDCMNEMHSITERDAFSYGFRLGVQLMAESFRQPPLHSATDTAYRGGLLSARAPRGRNEDALQQCTTFRQVIKG